MRADTVGRMDKYNFFGTFFPRGRVMIRDSCVGTFQTKQEEEQSQPR